MKILVTGGAGFIGSNIVDGYINKGHEVVVVDDLTTGHREFVNRKAGFYKADIRDKNEVLKIFAAEKPDILNHHAAQISVRVSVDNPYQDAEINILGLLNLLEAGKRNGLKKIIFASSGGVVYGDADIIPTPEKFEPKNPLSPYGIAKWTSELYLSYYSNTYKIPYIALRYSNVYGPRQNPHGEAGVVAIFTKKLLNSQKPVINGDGSQTRDYVFVEDVVSANIKSIASEFIGGINIGTGIETDVKQIFAGIKTTVKSGIKPEFGIAKKGEQKRSCLSNSLARKILGWTPRVNLASGLEKTVLYFKKNKNG